MAETATMQDVRRAGLCARGARSWARSRGYDWSRFLADGIPVVELEASGDALALRVASEARRRG